MTETKVTEQLIERIAPLIAPLGYEVVYLEIQTMRQKLIRIFIDRTDSANSHDGIGIEDCVKVTRALDEPLDQMPEVERIFGGAYELEVSSPGVDRPLRQSKDYQRFAGRDVRIHLFRPLTATEIENPAYLEKNPKQKNFLGKLSGLENGKVTLELPLGGPGGKPAKAGKKAKSKSKSNEAGGTGADLVKIPLELISKANLEPSFDDDLEGADAIEI